MYKPLEVMGPENEYSLVNSELTASPTSDNIIKDYCGKMLNFIELPNFTFGKEMQLHVMEIKANAPFVSPHHFEETMHNAVLTLSDIVQKYKLSLLGSGMHPLLKLNETGIWPHHHRKIYEEYGKLFNLNQHGWLNIQSFHLNLPYQKQTDAILQHNILSNVCPYLPAISASSPVFEGTLHETVDNRLAFYRINQKEVPSVSGDVVPEYVDSYEAYKKEIIGKYSEDLSKAGASDILLYKEWVNSRGIIFRFDRKALEIRVMDEQECVKSDVALSCFVRATLRGLLLDKPEFLPHEMLVRDFTSIVSNGLDAKVLNPFGLTARDVCQKLYEIAWRNADNEEKQYLPLIEKRIKNGSLSDMIRKSILKKVERTSLKEAIIEVYSSLIKCLITNQPYFQV